MRVAARAPIAPSGTDFRTGHQPAPRRPLRAAGRFAWLLRAFRIAGTSPLKVLPRLALSDTLLRGRELTVAADTKPFLELPRPVLGDTCARAGFVRSRIPFFQRLAMGG